MAAALFDVFGTLLDVYSVTRRAEELFAGNGERLARLWREKQIEYSRLRTMSGRYVSFSEVTRDALEYSLQALKLEAAPDDVTRLADEYKRLTPFVDVAPALARLHEAGVRTRRAFQWRLRDARDRARHVWLASLHRYRAVGRSGACVQDVALGVRARATRVEAAAASDHVCIKQLLGCVRSGLVWLHEFLGQSKRCSARTSRCEVERDRHAA